VRLVQSVISLLELDFPSCALAYSEGGGHCPFVSSLLRSLLKHTTARVCSRSIGVELWTREDTLLTTAERQFEMLSLWLAMSRPVARSGPESRVQGG
jgi:hypothetical protein